MTLDEAYHDELNRIAKDPDLKDKPLMIFYQMVQASLTYGKISELHRRTGIAYGSFANWLYSGVQPNATSFVKALAGMGFDVKIVRRNGDV